MEKSVTGLFAGVGGLELGLSRSGYRASAFVESDPHARAVLLDRFPDVPVHGDISHIESLPPSDVLTAGFPCQDLSQAGRMQGIHGGKSSLVSHVFRLMDGMERPPEWLLLENVPFLLHLNAGAGMDWLVSQLEARDFTWAYRIIDTNSFGLPQRRRRLYILASQRNDPHAAILSEDSGVTRKPFDGTQACGFYWTEGNTGLGWAVDAVPPLKGSSGLGIVSPPAVWLPAEKTFVTPSISDAEAMQGFDRRWTAAAESVPRGDRIRWRLVGNAVSVPVAQWVGAKLEGSGPVAGEETPLPDGSKWPTAAWGRRGERYRVTISEWPEEVTGSSLRSALWDPRPLSARAAKGFKTRLFKSTLRANQEFRDDLEAYVTGHRLGDLQADEGDEGERQSIRKGSPVGTVS